MTVRAWRNPTDADASDMQGKSIAWVETCPTPSLAYRETLFGFTDGTVLLMSVYENRWPDDTIKWQWVEMKEFAMALDECFAWINDRESVS